MSFGDWWIRVTTSKYTHALECEVLRLRAENRALLNSILGIAGVPPLPAPAEANEPALRHQPPAGACDSLNAVQRAARTVPTQPRANGASNAMFPPRKRSWQQINRMLEVESARKRAEV